jgi:hypothetical protein
VWAVPTSMTVQGRLSGSGGASVDGTFQVTFALWTEGIDGAQKWVEVQSVSVVDGMFSAALGYSNAIKPEILSGDEPGRWLEIKVENEPPLPRQLLRSVAFSFVSGGLDCTGCVTGKHIDSNALDVVINGLQYAKSADLNKIASYRQLQRPRRPPCGPCGW